MLNAEQNNPLDIIHAIKQMLIVCPHPESDEKVNKNFREFFFSFRAYCQSLENEPSERLRDKANYHLEMLWSHLLHEFMSPMWSYDENGFNPELQQRYNSGRIDTRRCRELIKLAIERDELQGFFKAFPYVRNLSRIDEFLKESAPSEDMRRDFSDLINHYLIILDYYDRLQPLLVLRELCKVILNHADVDLGFYNNYMKGAERHVFERGRSQHADLLYLSLFIGKNIPYDIRLAPGFNKLNWSAFDGLSRCFYNGKHTIDQDRVQTLAAELLTYSHELILFVLDKTTEDQVPEVDVSDLAALNTQQNIKPAFEIIENYLEVLNTVTQDNDTARLVTLRTITAIGEALRSIELLLPSDHLAQLQAIVILRDHIIHSSTLEAFHFLNQIISDQSQTSLSACLVELQQLSGYFTALKLWLESAGSAQQPPWPQLPNLNQLEQAFAQVRKKDDRDEKIPVAQRLALIESLPTENSRSNPLLSQVVAFVSQGAPMSREKFKSACPHLKASEAKKLHERVIENKKIAALRQAIAQKNVDFSRIRLNVSGSKKRKLKQIVEQSDMTALGTFLDEHEQNVKLTDEFIANFIDSIREIDLAPFKTQLQGLADGSQDVAKEAYEKAVKVVFGDDEAHKLWSMTYEMITKQRINSLKRYQLVQLEHTLENMARLKATLTPIFDGQRIDMQSDPQVMVAGEMLYGFCLEGFKRISKFLDKMYDYADRTLYFFQPNHPLQQVAALLETAIVIRNDIFHFERVFQGGPTVGFSRMLWFSAIQNLTFGTYFPEAIVISRQNVSRQPMMSDPTTRELSKLRDTLAADLPRDDDFLNMYEAEVKEIVARSRIAANTQRAMNSMIPLSQWIRQLPAPTQGEHREGLFLILIKYLDMPYLEPNVYIALLNQMVEKRVLSEQTVKDAVFSSQHILFAKQVMDENLTSETVNISPRSST